MFGCRSVVDSLRSEHWPEGDGGEGYQAGGGDGCEAGEHPRAQAQEEVALCRHTVPLSNVAVSVTPMSYSVAAWRQQHYSQYNGFYPYKYNEQPKDFMPNTLEKIPLVY